MEKKRKILLIDDSEVVSGLIASALEEAGFDVVRAVDGLEGIEKTYKEIPDCIIMDIEMPVMDGFQATRFIKSRRTLKSIPIIVHTTLSDDRSRNWAISCGGDAFFVKDFEQLDKLIQAITLWSDHEPYPLLEIMQEEAKTITREAIIQGVGSHLDKELLKSNSLNQLNQSSAHLTSATSTIESIFQILPSSTEFDVGLVLLRYGKKTLSFGYPGKNIFKEDMQDFINVGLNDFYERFPDLSQNASEEIILNLKDRVDFDSLRMDKEKIRSYFFCELKDKDGQIIGTIHLGHFVNNYFSEKIVAGIQNLIPLIGTLLANTLTYQEIFEKEGRIRSVFSKFIPAEVIDSLIEKQDMASLLVGEKRSVAILFSDIRSFTTISEYNTAEAVVNCLNNYFDLMAKAIKSQGGIIDKFIGDAILAVFGAPTSYEDNAARAVKAAITMIESLPQLDTSKLKLPKKGFQIGVGIHEGTAIVGNIGSKEKFDYTVIGDAVNLASRLEGVTKHYAQQVVISQSVKDKIETDFVVRELDNVKVKGKEQATAIYGLPIRDKELYTPEIAREYEKGLKMYKIQNWVTAMEYFQKVIDAIPEDFIAKMYMERCENFMKNPPGEGWDGSIELDFK